jgi:hypothetical protein
MQTLTRKQAIDLCGIEAVDRVDSANADFSGRELEDTIEFTASVSCGDDTLTAYYYQDRRDVDAVENLDELSWTVMHYTVM